MAPATDYERRVSQALDATWQRTPPAGPDRRIDTRTSRLILFSDQHKGARNHADDFLRCERTYNAALGWYYAEGFTLIELGDVEELWEENAGEVIRSYRHTLSLTARFLQAGRYFRLWGNHDDLWRFEDKVASTLAPVLGPTLKVPESFRFDVFDGEVRLGECFLVHGHQGEAVSDRWSRWTRIPVRYLWRPIQRLFKVSLNTPATDWVLRQKHNIALYRWAAARQGIVLIAGHTHRPVFKSETRSEQLVRQVNEARARLAELPGDDARREELARLEAELEWSRAQNQERSGAEGMVLEPMKRACYFNTGCCCYLDGDITGLEISDGWIHLVRWPDDNGRPLPQRLASMRLVDLFMDNVPDDAGGRPS